MDFSTPETRNSLILRLPDADDVEAWDQFVSIYQPLVYRLARTKGFQDADAHEIVQEVLVAVAGAIERWKPDAALGRFRDWLFRIARNLMINYFTRRKYRSLASGPLDVDELLREQVDPASDDFSAFDWEYRKEVFYWAASRVQEQVQPRTWTAFWETSVEGRNIAAVAAKLEMTSGAVHIARSRVLGRLRATVKQFEVSDHE